MQHSCSGSEGLGLQTLVQGFWGETPLNPISPAVAVLLLLLLLPRLLTMQVCPRGVTPACPSTLARPVMAPQEVPK
jgi:hypothetical protein